MWGHGHHRKGRLSLPSIRISTAPDSNKDPGSNSAPLDRGLSSSQPPGSRPISHDFQKDAAAASARHGQHHSRATGPGKRSQGASLSSSSAHDSVRSRHESGQHTQLLPAFRERPLTEEERAVEHSTLFKSLRGEYKPDEDDDLHHHQYTAADDPFMPPDLVAAIETSMKNCAEYERQCAQLEHSIEHKILMFSHILEQYEVQDQTATELREMISTAQAALQSTTPTMQTAEDTARTAREKLDGYQRTLLKAKEIAEKSKVTMSALEDHIHDQEIIHDKIAKWQRALLGTGTALVVFIAVLLAWLFS